MKNSVKQFAAGTLLILAVLFTSGNLNATEYPALSNETEGSLQLENWMTNHSFWTTNLNFAVEFAILDTEKPMEFENWMTNSNLWNNTLQFNLEMEESLELESWMTDDFKWTVNTIDADEKLGIESWMTDENIW